jgi:uncharacterized protein YkwD
MTAPARPLLSHTLFALGLAGALLVGILAPTVVLASGSTNPPSSPTSATVSSYLMSWLNRDRASHGLRALRTWTTLRDVAAGRASTLASLGVLSHTAPGNLSTQLSNAGVRSYAWGEDIGYSSYSWGYDVAKSLYRMWKNSPGHWALMMSSRYNYIGIGLAYRWSSHATYASMVFSESPDHTHPAVYMKGASRSGNDVRFSYSGYDPKLQTHTAGFDDFDLQYRIDGGNWVILKSHRTSTSITLYDRPRGHTYYLRVRGRDDRGNLSNWTGSLHVSVP